MAKLEQVYALSIYEIAKENQLEKIVLEELHQVSVLFEENKDIYRLIGTPVLSKKERLEIIGQIFSAQVESLVLCFLKLLTENSRIIYLSGMVEEYKKLYYQDNNMMEVEVVSAISLDDQTSEKLKNKISSISGKQVILQKTVDTTLMGGLIVKANHKQMDDSIRKKLNDIAKSIH